MRLIELRELLHELVKVLSGKVSSPELEAESILRELMGLSREEFLLSLKESIREETVREALRWATERAKGYPLDYLSGWSWFRGRRFKIKEGVFIPRHETEMLVDLALQLIEERGYERVLDVGTGSGCIAISLKLECPHLSVTAVDISEEAVRLAEENARLHRVELKLILGDVFKLAQELGGYHLIVSNPPYVSPEWYESHEELWYEPREAFVYGDGADFYMKMAEELSPLLEEGGSFCLELGHEFQEEAIEPFLRLGYEILKEGYLNDLRVAICFRKPLSQGAQRGERK